MLDRCPRCPDAPFLPASQLICYDLLRVSKLFAKLPSFFLTLADLLFFFSVDPLARIV
jgi:hypothetical protein